MPQAGNGAERTRRRSQYWSNRYSSILLIEWFCSIFITHLIQVCKFSFLKRNRTSKLSIHYNDLIYADLLDWAGIRKNCFILYHLKKKLPTRNYIVLWSPIYTYWIHFLRSLLQENISSCIFCRLNCDPW